MPEREDGTLIRRYLLGEVSSETAARLDDRLLADHDFYEQVMLEEDGLAEEYVRGTVPLRDLARMEAFLATPERQRNIMLTRALADRFAAEKPSVAPAALGSSTKPRRTAAWVGWAAAASLLLSTTTAVYFVAETRRLQRQLSAAIAPSAGVDASPATPVLSLVLMASATTRSPGAAHAVIVIPADAHSIQLQFQIPGAETNRPYMIEIRRAGGDQVWGGASGGTPAPQEPAQTVAVTLSAAVLAPDEYVALVSSPDGAIVHEYQFRVVRS